jgi:hypothetical protein
MLTGNSEENESAILMKLDSLGPMIINTDGSISKIPNWETFSDIEKKNAFRLIVIRNKKRLEYLQLSKTATDCESENPTEILAIDMK